MEIRFTAGPTSSGFWIEKRYKRHRTIVFTYFKEDSSERPITIMVIIINGSRNAGKTTTAQLLSKSLPKTAYIPIDALREFVRFLDLEQSIPLNLEGAVLLTRAYIRKGYNVILEYCLRRDDYTYLVKQLKPVAKHLYTFTLRPTRALALSDRGKRLSADDIKRIREQYNKRSPHFIPLLGTVIDGKAKTSVQSIMSIILDSLRSKE